ncbi:RNA polymerase sigma factor [Actinophytocola sp. NPDC049390]|uniref:RNA polymerase sigma factor n=1 Tax=Actinophytocola sp. NPDC049390 TaxID=3363894 RepID=UPI00378A77E3
MTDERPDESVIGRIFRAESGRSLAAVIGFCGDIDVAEDAVQDAFALALRKWPADGLPPNPGGWITTTARNRAIDRLRREARGRELATDAARLPALDVPKEVDTVPDDRLRLMFTCCHPALATETQVALTLRLLGGLSTHEVARAFLVAEPAMAARVVRAKRKIKAARIPYRVPEAQELPGRLRPVLAVVYLVYNAGLANPGLCAEAIRLARMLAELMPDEPEVTGLLALVLLIEARRAARTGADGSFVPLGEQDRGRWDRELIAEGQALVRQCLRRDQPGPYQVQAAIHAVHADATAAEHTDWPQILALYDRLLALTPTPVVALNRAIAVSEVHGPAAALELVDELDLDHYYAFHATRADLLDRLGRHDDAARAYRHAAALAPTDAERDFLRRGGRSGRRGDPFC